MWGAKIGTAIIGTLALLSTPHVTRNVNCIGEDPRVLAMVAQYKIAMGDDAGAYRLIERASRHKCSEAGADHRQQL